MHQPHINHSRQLFSGTVTSFPWTGPFRLNWNTCYTTVRSELSRLPHIIWEISFSGGYFVLEIWTTLSIQTSRFIDYSEQTSLALGTVFSVQWSGAQRKIYLLGKLLVLIDKVAHFSLTWRRAFAGWVNYAALSNHRHFSFLPWFPRWTVKTNDWKRYTLLG